MESEGSKNTIERQIKTEKKPAEYQKPDITEVLSIHETGSSSMSGSDGFGSDSAAS